MDLENPGPKQWVSRLNLYLFSSFFLIAITPILLWLKRNASATKVILILHQYGTIGPFGCVPNWRCSNAAEDKRSHWFVGIRERDQQVPIEKKLKHIITRRFRGVIYWTCLVATVFAFFPSFFFRLSITSDACKQKFNWTIQIRLHLAIENF